MADPEATKDGSAKVDLTVQYLPSGEQVSTLTRVITDVPPPATFIPTHDQFFSKRDPSKPDLEFLKTHLTSEGRLSEEQALFILKKATEIMTSEPNMLELPTPITVCGDIHGQFYDLMKLFEVGNDPFTTPYLFLGDYVDRGQFSIECVLFLWSLKLCYPKSIFLLRGNHECRHLTSYFTFKAECIHKYSEKVYEACIESFCALPLAAVVGKQFLCVHGGLSPDLKTLDDFKMINRFCEPPTSGLMCDLLWSDPTTDYGQEVDSNSAFIRNPVRGCSYSYTYKAVCSFLERNNLLSVIRAHEAQKEGFKMYKKGKSGFPSLITLFSAPNYLDNFHNKAAIMICDRQITMRQFNAVEHPYLLPNFMDVFEWSVPFIGTTMTNMFLALLSICSDEELAEAEKQEEEAVESIEDRKEVIKNKVRAFGKMTHAFSFLRKEEELIAKLKALMGSDSLPAGTLSLGLHGIKDAIASFEEAQLADVENEKLPPPYSSLFESSAPMEYEETVQTSGSPNEARGSQKETEVVMEE
ncbi:calcineurin [Obelidium mucronatum]|nr:calcineurin [Obelidium mucronatum]